MESTTMQQSSQPVVTGRTLRYRPLNLARWIIWTTTALLMLVMPLAFSGGFAITLMSQMGIMIIFALSYNMLLGQTGMLSFGHAVYSGLGAFIAVHVLNMIGAGKVWLPVSMLPLVGGLAGAFFGVLFGYVTTKKSGTTFAMITMGIGEMVFASSLMFPDFFGGEGGISTNRVVGDPFLGITFGPGRQVYYLIAIWCFLSMVAMYAWTQTPLGRIANAVRDNPERVEFIGYNTQRVRYLVLILSAFFAGIAGALSAINFEIVSAENVSAVRSGGVLLAAFIGGAGVFFGPVIGAIVFTLFAVALSDLTKAWLLYLGLFFVMMVMFVPGGIASLLLMQLPLVAKKQLGRMLPAYARGAVAGLVLLAAMILTVEMVYKVQVDSANGTAMSLLGIGFDAGTLTPWIVAAVLWALGYAAWRWATTKVRAELDAIQAETGGLA
ncbi:MULTISPECIES: branched-chain amino acid ABC transporter permease [unclassified Cupriavidus]|uniref:branched-chain amino acid ABC transporter permease n=1 Tax=unclassified Cupriavidus TaxID=2640874 RepID=UPI001BFFF98E|nr:MULTISPECIES: branched-chain amino acid ABC transporter permease [unclassified Cupriavidus]MCA3189338.1 branched-chain amino acid ABC transporter permease [Cupriavidus sp.]MCA3195418.1 branched-chain amino acid ABC transporter permease [Cupriavidus sp.]MCA3200973.1 branched-chain amino acid ABC transporter permease [Cupriavidus sp.]MCA3208346.1 branched-chain amino acid ABC transporter permease [Cupriavidus sp.]MCA3233428.1 branched-chain amino acid ABC transporter permease [Cupriavidus sp.